MANKKIPFFSVLGEKQTYLNLVYILFAFPLSVFYFTLTITGLSLSLGLLILVAGFFIFIGTLIMVQGFRWLDVQLTRRNLRNPVFQISSNVFLVPDLPGKVSFFTFLLSFQWILLSGLSPLHSSLSL